MGSSPLPFTTLPFHLNPQIAKSSVCRLIPIKTFFLSMAFLAAFILLPGIYNFGWGQTAYTSSGNFAVPAGVTQIKVECWGAGGAGGGNTTNKDGGGGGGGGAYSRSILTVLPGNTYTVTVGDGGNGSTGNGGNGGDTWVISNATILAKGGTGGFSPAGGTGGIAGTGGASANCIGTYPFSGGNGGTGINDGNGRGGPGGSSAGNKANGTSGATTWSTTTAGAAPTGGGIAGNGGDNGANGSNGTSPGGGGGGSGEGNKSGGNGANGYVVITLPSNVALASTSQVTAGNVYQGSTRQPIYSFATTVSTSNATINAVSFTTAGTYVAGDVSRFELLYNATNDITTATPIGSDITTTLGTGQHTFTGLNQVTNSGTTGYFWITTDFPNNATSGVTISVNAITTTNLTYEIANVTGSATAGGTQTIIPVANIVLSSGNPAVPTSPDVYQGTLDQPVYSFSTAVSNAVATLNAVKFNTTGSYIASDVTKFKLWCNSSNDLSTAFQIGSAIISTLGTGSHTFSGLTLTANSGTTSYFWITVDIAPFPKNNSTIVVSAISTVDLTYLLGIKSGTASAGGTQTIQTHGGVLISTTHPSVSASSILQGSVKQPIYKFTTIVTGANATINSVLFTTTGTYAVADVLNYKLWYNTVNSLVSAIQIGTTITTSLGIGNHTFSGLTQATNDGNTGYFWVTVDVAGVAVSGHTLSVNAFATNNLNYASGITKYASTYLGGIQTIQLMVDSEGDGVPDLYDLDDDNDGIPDVVENAPCNTSAIELFPNTDFSQGNTGFSSAYTYAAPAGNTTLNPEGLYTIVTNPKSIHNDFSVCGDHTTGTGNMMVVNADPKPNKVVWSSGLITVMPYTDYTLSLYLASVHPTNPAQLIFNVNSENIGIQFNATTTTCQWVNGVAIWNSGSNTTATFDIVNLNLATGGNDFALDDISCKYRINCDSDGDGLPDKLDLDSDNDGIYDVVEAGGTDANNDGNIDGFSDTDHDGLADAVDNQDAGSGTGEIISGTPLANPDTDGDGSPNRIDLDSDGDGCYDALEAGFTDSDNDGKLGSSPVVVNTKGKVTSAIGYTAPADANSDGIKDYIQKLPFITTQPVDKYICTSTPTNTNFAVVATNTGGTFQWQVSTNNGTTWNNISTGGIYTNVTTATLNLTNVTAAYDGFMYRALLSNPAYKCSPLISDAVTLRAFGSAPSQPGTITGNATVCPSVSSVYSIAALPTALSYTWTLPLGWLVTTGAGTNAITALSGASGGSVSITATNTCGTSTAKTIAVTISTPSPSITAPLAGASVCQSADVTYTTQTGNSNYVWTITTGSLGADYTITSGGSSTDNTLTLKWITTGSKTVTVNYTSGGCSGTAATRTITINANTIINTQPVSPAAICAGTGSRSIGVVATGTPTYQWQVSTDGGSTWSNLSNTAPYSNVTSATMTITSPAITLNNAQYHCLVTGTCGAATSNPAILTVNSSAISSQSTNTQTQCIGGAFTPISVTTYSTGLSYQWYSNTVANNTTGTIITGATNASYTPLATTAGTLYYYCIVSGTCGSATITASGAFIVTTATAITAQSTATQTKCISGTFTPMTVSATGTGALTYQWYSNTTTTTTGGTSLAAANGAQTSSYTPQATTIGTLYYYCIVTGTCGSVTSSASGAFVVTAATAITAQSTATQTKCINGTFTPITVTATGTGALTYQWYSNTTTTTTGGTSLAAANGAQTSSYTPQATTIGTLYYYCIVTGTCGSVTSSASGAFIVSNIAAITLTQSNETCPASSDGAISTNLSGGLSNIRYIKITQQYADYTNLADLQTIESFTGTNLSLGATASASSTYGGGSYPASEFIDGITSDGENMWHSATGNIGESIIVDLGAAKNIDYLRIYNRVGCCQNRSQNLLLEMYDASNNLVYNKVINVYEGINGPHFIDVNILDLNWTDSGNPLNRSGLNPGSYTLNYADASGCSASATTIISTTNSASTTPAAITGTTIICNGNSTTLSVSVGSLGTGATWKWYSGACGVSLVGTGTSVIVSPTSNTTYFVRAEGACNTTACASITVNVNPTPTVGPQVVTICSGTAFTVSPTGVPAGTTYSWAAPVVTGGITGGSAQATGQTSISQTLTNPTITAQTATYTVTPTSGTCAGATFTVTVTVNPVPTVANQAATICSGTAFTVTPAEEPAGTTYTWTAPVVTGGITGGSAQATGQTSISQTLTNPTYVTQTATYTVTPTAPGSCQGLTFTVTITVTPIGLWLGGTAGVETDWNTANNWSCGFIPLLTTNVLIPNVANKPILSGSVIGLAKDITIAAGSSLTITDGNTIQISGDIKNGGGTFIASTGKIEMVGTIPQKIEAGVFALNPIMDLTVTIPDANVVTLEGSLSVTGIVKVTSGNFASGGNLTLISTALQTALIDGSGSGEVTGNVTMQRYLPSGFGYKYFSSPFSNATVAALSSYLSTTATIPTFYAYDEENHRDSAGVNAYQSGWAKYLAGTLAPLSGYAANFGSDIPAKTVSITGTVNNGPMSVSLFNHNRRFTKGFNLVGNPYPSPIDWKKVNWTTSNIDKAIYFFNAGNFSQYTGSYTSYVGDISTGDGTNIIASMQGFFVHVSDGTFPVSATLSLSNSIRTNDLSPTFKAAIIDYRTILRFAASFETKNAIEDIAVIYFDDNANRSFEKDKDALKMLNTDELVPNLYSISTDPKQLSINGMPLPTDSITKIPLGIKTLSDGWIKFKAKDISKLPSNMHIYLTDAIGNITQDLKQHPDYRFYLKAGEYNQRFTLVFALSSLDKPAEIVEKMFTIIRSGDRLYVKVNLPFNTKGDLLVTNMQGKTLLQKSVFEMETVEINPNVGSGVYVVTMIVGKRKESEKILIRKDYE